MDADVGDDAAGAIGVTLPRHVVPPAACRDVGEPDAMPLRRVGLQTFAQRHQLRVHAQLQDGRDPATGFLLELLKRIEVPRIDHQRLLANDVGADAEGEAHVGIVQVIGRAHAHVVHARFVRTAAQLLEMPIETLELGEEPAIERKAIEDAHRVVGIGRRHEAVAGVLNGFEVPGCDVARNARDREISRLGHVCTEAACFRIRANRGAVTRRE